MLNGLSVVRIVIILLPVVGPYDRLTRSLCSSPITAPSSLLRIGPSQCSASVLSPHGAHRLCFSLDIRALVPAVPRESQHPVHAPYAPIAVCPVFRRPTDLSQWRFRPLVLTMLKFFTTLHRRVCLRSSPGRTPARGHALSFCSNAHDHGFWPQPLGVVWDLLLKADPEGPALISHAAVRHLFNPCCLLSMCLCGTPKPRNLKVSGFRSPTLARLSAKLDQAGLVRM